MMIRITADKIGSATKNVPLRFDLRLDDQITAKEGYILAGRIRGDKTKYNTLENCDGRMVVLNDGDIVVGALGHRNALHGYSGVIPESIAVGDTLHVLNLGGVIGHCTSSNPDVGKPFDFEVLGSVLVFPEFANRTGVPAHVSMNALPAASDEALLADTNVPIIFIAGTCMNAGKTLAACQIIREFNKRGISIAAAKLTGVSLLRDTLNMIDHGAQWSSSFIDAGVVTTGPETALTSARAVLSHLGLKHPDVIVAELGDGILGMYGVQNILANEAIRKRIGAFVLCANDPAGAWGSQKYLKENFDISIDVITGPTTDNNVGSRFIEQTLSLQAINARSHGKELADAIYTAMNKKQSQKTL
jgi:hypothetical protein